MGAERKRLWKAGQGVAFVRRRFTPHSIGGGIAGRTLFGVVPTEGKERPLVYMLIEAGGVKGFGTQRAYGGQ